MMPNISLICFLASYAVAFGLELTRLLGRSAISRIVMVLFAAAGLVAHTLYLLHRSRQTHLPPLLSSAHDWLLVLAWLAVVFYLFLSVLDLAVLRRNSAFGLFLLPLVLIFVIAARFVSNSPSLAFDAQRGWKMLHASLLVLGTAGILLGFVLSLMYLVQHRRLKHKQTLHSGLALPSLERLARFNWWSIIVSVPLLTFGMATGVGLAVIGRNNVDAAILGDPVVIGSSLVWLLMAALFLWLLTSRRAPGRQVAWLTIWACGFLLLTMVGLQVLTGSGRFGARTLHANGEGTGVRDHGSGTTGQGSGVRDRRIEAIAEQFVLSTQYSYMVPLARSNRQWTCLARRASDCSPRRKPWEGCSPRDSAPSGAIDVSRDQPSVAPDGAAIRMSSAIPRLTPWATVCRPTGLRIGHSRRERESPPGTQRLPLRTPHSALRTTPVGSTVAWGGRSGR